jgi:hypothetical protein
MITMPQDNIIIPGISLGQFAKGLLHQQGNAVPAGISSRGLYLRAPDNTILFLSLEKYRGPLTVNIDFKHAAMPEIKSNSSVFLSPTKITVPGEGIQVNLENAEVWNPSLPSGRLPVEISRSRLKSAIEDTQHSMERNNYQYLLDSVLPGNNIHIPDLPGFTHYLTEFLAALERSKPTMEGKELSGLLGLGPGLTPLGDDFILGVILTLNRWRQVLIPVQGLKQFNKDLLKDAGNKTTALSASLLTCAIEGAADERLLVVLDSFFSGDESSSRDLDDMLKWGSSSGIGVLAGMLSVVTRLF